jgi:coproporphyrinogen III oxidase-like Fe-S oxidoreductase
MNKNEIVKKVLLFRKLTEAGVMLHPYITIRKYTTSPVENTKNYWSKFITNNPDALVSVYINIPYCKNNKCRYCMYNSKILKSSKELADYVGYLTSSMEYYKNIFNDFRFSAFYLGGGTPSLLKPDELSTLLSASKNCFSFRDKSSMTYEISPSSIDEEKLRAARMHGINRVSIGVQSTNEETLKQARRPYITPDELSRIVNTIRKIGFEEINIDLISGLPGDSIAGLSKSFSNMASLLPTSVTVYLFRLENSRYPEKIKKQYVHLHDVEIMNKSFETLVNDAARFGFEPPLGKAVSRIFLRKDFKSDLITYPTVWVPFLRNSCLGLGVGSRSYIDDKISFTEIGPCGLGRDNICNALGTSLQFDRTLYLATMDTLEDRMRDYFLHCLYEKGWVSLLDFESLYGKNPLVVYTDSIAALETLGKIEIRDNKLYLNFENQFEFGVYSKFFMDEEALENAIKARFGVNAHSS